MNKTPLVTVFIAAYNCEEYIQETIKSILNQTYENLEILIIDDGSEDGTVKKIKEFMDSRIKLYQNNKNKGIPYTRNKGINLALGEFIAIIDADDISVSNRIEKQVDFMLENKSIDVLGTFYKTLGNKFPRVVKTKFIKPEEIRCYLMFYNNIANPTAMIRKETIHDFKLTYDESFFVAQDYKLWSEIIKYGRIQILPEPLTQYRVGHQNITNLSKKDKEKATKRKFLIDSIHEDLLNYFGFELTDKELQLFNNIFTDNVSDDFQFDIEIVLELINKLCECNILAEIFSEEKFNEILVECVCQSIQKHNLKLNDKIKFIHSLLNNLKISNNSKYFDIVLNHFIEQIKKIPR